MSDFLEVGLEEFDWFANELQMDKSYDEYQEIEDLKLSYENGLIYDDVPVEVMTETDGVTWRYCENLQEAMHYVFSQVYENLCGCELEISSDILIDYVNELNNKCVVLQSPINPKQSANGSAFARIDSCLSEGGSVVLAVSDGKWRKLMHEPESCFLDSGLRTLQVLGMNGDALWISDCANQKGDKIEMNKSDLDMLDGILMEVYK